MELEHYVRLFDESYTNIVKNGQMDMHIKCWDTSLNIVKMGYCNSHFKGEAAAKDVLKTFKECVNGMDEDKLLQVAMDGTDVNTSFLTSLKKEKIYQELSHLVSLGFCGLRAIHNSFKHGENVTGCNSKKLL